MLSDSLRTSHSAEDQTAVNLITFDSILFACIFALMKFSTPLGKIFSNVFFQLTLFKITFSFSFSFFFQDSFGQNLVPNWSFEIHDSCPSLSSQIERALGWKHLHSSPDYFNRCSTINLYSIPQNVGGYHQPEIINDSAYVGLITLVKSNIGNEIIGIDLFDTLIIGQKYYISYSASSSIRDSNVYHCTCFSDKMGIKLRTHSVPSSFYNPQLIDNVSQFYASTIVSVTIGWVHIKGSFIADSAYTFLMVGNFFSSANINYTCLDSSGDRSYTYIDRICISPDSSSHLE